MDFEVLIPDHDAVGKYSDVRAFRHYLEDLESAVVASIKAGLSVEEMKQSITLNDYREWAYYEDWFAFNVEGLYRLLTVDRRPSLGVSVV